MELPVFAKDGTDNIKNTDALLKVGATVDLIQSCIPNIKNARQMPVPIWILVLLRSA